MERLSQMEGMVGWEEPLDDKLWTGRSRKIDMEDDMEMDPKMMMYNQEEIQEDAYILGGMWYLNNWVLTSRMSKDQWNTVVLCPLTRTAETLQGFNWLNFHRISLIFLGKIKDIHQL